MTTRPAVPGQALTIREAAVCEALCVGMSTKEIARTLQVSPRTIEGHRQRVMVKMGVRNAVELVRIVLMAQFAKFNGGTP